MDNEICTDFVLSLLRVIIPLRKIPKTLLLSEIGKLHLYKVNSNSEHQYLLSTLDYELN